MYWYFCLTFRWWYIICVECLSLVISLWCIIATLSCYIFIYGRYYYGNRNCAINFNTWFKFSLLMNEDNYCGLFWICIMGVLFKLHCCALISFDPVLCNGTQGFSLNVKMYMRSESPPMPKSFIWLVQK